MRYRKQLLDGANLRLWNERLRADVQSCLLVLEICRHDKIDQDAINAELSDGVLTLKLNKSKEARPRRIEIK